MFRIVDGPPGSGKSYYMVEYLSNFFTYDSFYDEFMVKDSVLIISNLEGLKIKHLDLVELLKKYSVEEFFSVPNFERIQKQYKVKNIVLLVDEAQKIFDRKFYDKDVFYFFQYHRHLGVDILFGTQHARLVANSFIPLCEYIVSATPRSKSVIGNFSYKYKDTSGNFMYSKVLRKKQTTFRAYKSMVVDEISKPRNAIKYWLVIALVLFAGGGLCFKTALAAVKSKSVNAQKKADEMSASVKKHNQISSARVAVVPSAVPVSPPPAPAQPTNFIPVTDISNQWETCKVDGFVQVGDKYLIYAGGIHQKNYKSFDKIRLTVQVPFGLCGARPVATVSPAPAGIL